MPRVSWPACCSRWHAVRRCTGACAGCSDGDCPLRRAPCRRSGDTPMSPGAFDAAGTDAPLDALAHALAGFDVVPERALFLRARAGGAMARFARTQWLHEQTFRPAVDRLQRLGHLTGSPASGDRFPLVLVLP